MQRAIVLFTVITILIATQHTFAQENINKVASFPELTGPYFGQTLHSSNPEIFAPTLLVKPKQAHSNIVFSADGTKAYWCSNGILYSELINDKWTSPVYVPFSSAEYSDDAPFLHPNGTQLFFTSKRAINDSDSTRKENIWVVDIMENGWSSPRVLPPVVNDTFQHWQFSVDANSNIYFGYREKGKDRDIVCCPYEEGEYKSAKSLGPAINSEHTESNPFISPEGDYIIFTRKNNERLENGRQNISLFISFLQKDGKWSESINLKKYLNFQHVANCAIVTRNREYLFFLDIYEGKYQRFWIKADFLDDLQQSNLFQ